VTTTIQIPSSPQEWVSALADLGFYTTAQTTAQIQDWLNSDIATLIIKGPPYGGKTALAESIIRVLDGGGLEDLHKRVMSIFYHQDLDFGQLFFKWEGRKRTQAVEVMRELGKSREEIEQYETDPSLMDEGLLLRAIRNPSYNFVLIDFYTGPLDDENADRALADFIERQQIHIPELGRSEKRKPGQKLKVIITLVSHVDEQTLTKGHAYEAMTRHAAWLRMDKIDRQYQFHVLSHVVPKLNHQVIRDLILFVEWFNKLPGVNHHVTLGETIDAAKSLERKDATELTYQRIDRLRCYIAKTIQCSELFDKRAADIIASVKNEAF
jgi:hypothetical protein